LTFAELIAKTRAFLSRADKLKVYRGTAATKAGVEEPRQLLKELESTPLEEVRKDVKEMLALNPLEAGSDLHARLDRVLPRMARLRHDVLEQWTEFRKVMRTAFERTEQQIDRASQGQNESQSCELEERVSAQIGFLLELAEKLIPPPPAPPAAVTIASTPVELPVESAAVPIVESLIEPKEERPEEVSPTP
jgi:hypothetical protein